MLERLSLLTLTKFAPLWIHWFVHVLLPSSGSSVIYVMYSDLCLGFKNWYFSFSLKLCVFSVVQIGGLQIFFVSNVIFPRLCGFSLHG